MFEVNAIIEYFVVAACTALLYALCTYRLLGALQQAGYDGKQLKKWMVRKGNMTRSRYTLLAFLIALSVAVFGLCFSFAGKLTAFVALLPIPLFTALYCAADKKSLKVPLRVTRRVARIYLFVVLLLFAAAFALVLCGNAAAYYSGNVFAARLRYLLLSILPLAFGAIVRLANACEKPFSAHRNQKYLRAAKTKLDAAPCVKIAVAGSCGKTSVKNFLAKMLSARYRVLFSPESYNTPLGIAKTVEKENLSDYDFFIAETGARRAGEIAELCALVSPDHCILTGVCPQHVETFGSIECVMRTKYEVFEGTKKGGFAVVGQDENTKKFGELPNDLVCIAVGDGCDYGAFDVVRSKDGTEFTLALGSERIRVRTKLLGEHNARNLALAAAMAYRLGIGAESIAETIAEMPYVTHRLQPIQAGGVLVLDDAYNANVRGAAEAVEVLRLFDGKKAIVTPGLVELGILQEEENTAFGARLAGLDLVILVGATLVGTVKNGYLANGGDPEKLRVVPTLKDAQDLLSKFLCSGDTVLFLNDLPDIYA